MGLIISHCLGKEPAPEDQTREADGKSLETQVSLQGRTVDSKEG